MESAKFAEVAREGRQGARAKTVRPGAEVDTGSRPCHIPRAEGTMEPLHQYAYDSIAHADHEVLSPLSQSKLDYVVDLLGLRADARVLDLAAGKGELFIRVLERYGCAGEAIDPSPLFQAAMRAEASSRLEEGRATLIEADPYEVEVEPDRYDLVMCLGAHPYGNLSETMTRAWALVRSGGMFLFADWHWLASEPSADYIDFLGCGVDTYETHEGLVALGQKEAFTPMYLTTASRDEIDHYESQANWSIERWLRANPGDARALAVRERSRKWRDAYLQWGRRDLGYGLYLFLK